MTYIYDRSEEYRAKILTFFGTVLCSPLCIEISNQIDTFKLPPLWMLSIEFTLFIAGLLTINNSYTTMKERDREYAKYQYRINMER